MKFNASNRSALSHIEAAALLEAVQQALLVLDMDGCVTYASTHARQLLGAPMDRLRGRPFHLLFCEAALVRGAVQQMLREQPEKSRALRLAQAGESSRTLHARLVAIDDPDTLPHLLVHLRLRRASRRSPTAERAGEKLSDIATDRMFAS